MPRLTTVEVCAAGLIAIAVVLGALARPAERPKPVAREEATGSIPSSTGAVSIEPPPGSVARRIVAPNPTASSGGEHAPAAPHAPELPDDASVLTTLHELAASDPEQSLRLARAALERSPSSSSAPEFNWNVVKALYNLGRFDEATDEARTMMNRYPESELSTDVMRHLVNPQPNPEPPGARPE